jgi:hypothetical protein
MTVIVTADKQSEVPFFFFFCCSHVGNIHAHITADQLTIFLEGGFITYSILALLATA